MLLAAKRFFDILLWNRTQSVRFDASQHRLNGDGADRKKLFHNPAV